jgi:ribose transport system substrate-binding protein
MNKPYRLIALLIAALALVVAGCGSSDDDSTSTSGGGPATAAQTTDAAAGDGDSEAAAEVAELEQRPTDMSGLTPFEGEFPKDKTIDYLQCGVPACVKLGTYLKDATDAVGWKLNIVNIGGTPEEVKAGFDKAVRDKPDGVITTGGFDRAIYGQELEKLKAAGIPVLGHSEAAAAAPDEGMIAVTSGPERHAAIGKAWADWIVANSGDQAKVLFIDSGFPVQGLEKAALEARLGELCPDCTLDSYQAPIESIGKDLPGKIAQQLQKNPDTTDLVVGFGDMVTGLPAAMKGAGIGKLNILTQEPADANLTDMANGDLTVMHYGSGPESMWGLVDVLGRSFTDQAYPAEPELPRWLITKDTLPEGKDWPAVEDYQTEFKEAWGIQ